MNKGDEFNIRLSADEALVFYDWLARFNESDNRVPGVNEAEEKVLSDIECSLEKILSEPFAPNYEDLVALARDRVLGK